MKPLLIVTAILMFAGLITGPFIFEKSPRPKPPTIDTARNQEILEERESAPLQPTEIEGSIGYSLEKDKLHLTYDNGDSWTEVPIEKDQLFQGEYNGSQEELMEGSYVLTKDRASFLYAAGETAVLLTSLDKGETWEETVVANQISGLRFRKIDFIEDSFGYAVLSGGRTMSSELSTIYLTKDGGETWQETESSGVQRLLYDGGFVDKNLGFLSYGTLNPEEPTLYYTDDGGVSWHTSHVEIPEQYERVFVMAKLPFKENDHLAVYIEQGPNGDYNGGLVQGKFISADNGQTWEFDEEVQPDEITD
ncbi:WD40/YVTN/BNR-like repeat-containing protein [Halobacillus massiliensis]|uniref:WD40/YVTN/BNR-like repeat-containing protein n=1 Tax=Halobacillus massiliensis TaxID=1926286 RepID=UPI0009E5C36B|nr:hypothetical protein [Halobacillus massiliensis]